MLSLSTYYAVLCCNAQAGAVVISFGKTILVQDVKIGLQIFSSYSAQIDDWFFKT
jgi:hypothetical protein